MCRMAIATCRRHRKAAFQQPFPMDTLRIVVNDLVFRPCVPHCGFLSLLVALAAQHRDVDRKDRGLRICSSFHFVRAVAFLAGWPIRIIIGDQSAVHAALVLLPHFGMAGRTIHFLCDGLTRAMSRRVDTRMALAA